MKYRRGVAVLLTAVLVLMAGLPGSYAEQASSAETAATPAAVTTQGSGGFTDIKGHWAESIIKEAAGLQIVGGYPDGTFLPDNLIKREEFFKLLSNVLTEKPDTASTKIPFTDVVSDEWYVPTIKIAVAAGITSGYGDGTFGIGLMISRQEAAKVAGSVISKEGVDGATGAETARDKGQIADWAYSYVDLMFKKKYMKGDTEGNFRPTTALTRAEAATILLNIKKNEPVITAKAGPKTELTLAGCTDEHSVTGGAFTRGEGTQKDPYQISTEEQLNHMREHATEGAFYILTKNVAITKDYVAAAPPANSGLDDWSEGNFQPIGTKAQPFKGTLDCAGYIISGLNIIGRNGAVKGSNRPAADYAGLFGYLASGAVVKDLTIDASNITGNQYTGAVAGYSEGSVTECQAGKKVKVEGAVYTGGLIGYSTAPLSSLRNQGTVTGGYSNTGGIAGYLMSSGKALLDCQNEGEITGKDKTGGIVGTFLSDTADSAAAQDCSNKGTVEGQGYNAGGIAGLVSGGNNAVTIEKCTNLGTVKGSGVNGGIAGLLDSKKVTVIKCNNDGEVTGSGAGGIVGNNQGRISDCYNSGSIEAKQDGGGIAAYQPEGDGVIVKCYNEGTVTATSCAGGITGTNETYIDNSYNSGKVRGDSFIGGIAGKNTGTIDNVYGAGTVTGETAKGSIAGRNNGYITNSYWLDRSASLGVGLEDNVGRKQGVRKVTHEELSGQKKISVTEGFTMLIDVMNSSANSSNKNSGDVWKYTYKISVPASGNSTVISDGGSIVPPLTMPSLDSTGNTIDPSDLQTKYLYPRIIN